MSHLNDQLKKQMELLKPDFKEELSLKHNILDAAVGDLCLNQKSA